MGMGLEKRLTRKIMALILGVGNREMEHGITPDGTPNHRALAVAFNYGWALEFGNETDRKKARNGVEELFKFQNNGGHYTWGNTNECLTASHYNWWGVALAALRWFARKHEDARVLQLTGDWWRQEMALLSLLWVPSGRLAGSIVAPGGRTEFKPEFLGSGESVPRDVVYRLIMGLQVKKSDAWFRTAVEPKAYYQGQDGALPALDLTAPWIVRELVNAGDDFGKARAAGQAALNGDRTNMPKLKDRLHIVRTPKGHVAWFEDMTDTKNLPPQYWAWCDYAAGKSDYGLKPSPPPPEPPGGGFGGGITRIEV